MAETWQTGVAGTVVARGQRRTRRTRCTGLRRRGRASYRALGCFSLRLDRLFFRFCAFYTSNPPPAGAISPIWGMAAIWPEPSSGSGWRTSSRSRQFSACSRPVQRGISRQSPSAVMTRCLSMIRRCPVRRSWKHFERRRSGGRASACQFTFHRLATVGDIDFKIFLPEPGTYQKQPRELLHP